MGLEWDWQFVGPSSMLTKVGCGLTPMTLEARYFVSFYRANEGYRTSLVQIIVDAAVIDVAEVQL